MGAVRARASGSGLAWALELESALGWRSGSAPASRSLKGATWPSRPAFGQRQVSPTERGSARPSQSGSARQLERLSGSIAAPIHRPPGWRDPQQGRQWVSEPRERQRRWNSDLPSASQEARQTSSARSRRAPSGRALLSRASLNPRSRVTIPRRRSQNDLPGGLARQVLGRRGPQRVGPPVVPRRERGVPGGRSAGLSRRRLG